MNSCKPTFAPACAFGNDPVEMNSQNSFARILIQFPWIFKILNCLIHEHALVFNYWEFSLCFAYMDMMHLNYFQGIV